MGNEPYEKAQYRNTYLFCDHVVLLGCRILKTISEFLGANDGLHALYPVFTNN